jgi:hypothetical protein
MKNLLINWWVAKVLRKRYILREIYATWVFKRQLSQKKKFFRIELGIEGSKQFFDRNS